MLLSAAAVLPHEGLWLGAYGSSDGVAPIRPQTPFEIGSVTKTFVATTLLRLAEECRLNLETFEANPQLKSPFLSDTLEDDFQAVLYYDSSI